MAVRSVLLVEDAAESAGNAWLTLARAAQARGWAVAFASPAGARRAEAKEAGMEALALPDLRARGMPGICAAVRLAALYRARRPALIHHFGAFVAPAGTLAALTATRAAVVNALAPPLPCPVAMRWLARARRVHTLAPTQALLDRLVADGLALAARSSVAPDIVPPPAGGFPAHAAEPPGPPTAALAGPLSAASQIDRLAAAGGDLRTLMPAARLIVAGAPDDRAPGLSARLAEWHDDGLLQWCSPPPEPGGLWEITQVAVLPAAAPGWTAPLLAAMAAGRPVVAIDDPAVRTLVTDGETGFLVVADDAAAMAERIARLLGDGSLRRRLGEAARAHARAALAEDAIGRTLAIYETALGGA